MVKRIKFHAQKILPVNKKINVFLITDIDKRFAYFRKIINNHHLMTTISVTLISEGHLLILPLRMTGPSKFVTNFPTLSVSR